MANVNIHFKVDASEPIDFLIVGQGLSGTLLAYFLLLENQRIKVIDLPLPGATSGIAAGIVNPVTGRRYAKSWRFEELRPFAKATYCSLENLLGISLWQDKNILRALPTVLEENEWLRRSGFPDYEPYFQEPADMEGYRGKVKPVRAWGELKQGAQVAVPALVAAFRNYLFELDLLVEEVFDYQAVEIEVEIQRQQGRVGYRHFTARKIIFCEGARATDNPFFNYLPFSVTKGELLLVHIPGARFGKLLKHHVMISAFGEPEAEIFWVGSTSRFEFEGTEPTPEKRQWLEEQLREILDVPFAVVSHLAGIRPTVFDIRPFLGLHPQHDCLGIFNGMGTKGASLAPFFAKQMADFLLGKGKLDAEVDIARFARIGT